MKLVQRSGSARVLAAGILVGTVSALPVAAQDADTTSSVNIDDAVINFYIETRTQQPASQASAENRDAYIAELLDIYLLSTQPQARELASDPRIQAQLQLQERGLLAQAVAGDFMTRNAATDAEILAEYENQIKLAPPLDFKARHILVGTQALAIDIISQLDAGSDFQELARTNSTDSSSQQGGDLGWFSPDRMVKPFAEAVASLDDGKYTKTP
ncbi:MAG: peptidylprolyl isomerase, partial [Methyloligellaceae bacterium]